MHENLKCVWLIGISLNAVESGFQAYASTYKLFYKLFELKKALSYDMAHKKRIEGL